MRKAIITLLFINIFCASSYAQYVQQRRPVRKNVGAIIGAMELISQQHYEALNIREQIIKYMNSLDINIQDEEWKNKYLQHAIDRIDNAAEYGSYSTALRTAERIGEDIINDKEIRARVLGSRQYRAFGEVVRKEYPNVDVERGFAEEITFIKDYMKEHSTSIYQIESGYIHDEELGDSFFSLSLLYAYSQNRYKDWLYVIYLAGLCGDESGKDITERIMLKEHFHFGAYCSFYIYILVCDNKRIFKNKKTGRN